MKQRDTSYSNFVLQLVLVCTILILGSTIIYAFRSDLIPTKKDNTELETKEDSQKKLVDQLYQYVTYGRDLQPMYYFFKNKEITSESFDNMEKVAYAFQLANKDEIMDFTEQGFTVNGDVYKKWIETIFGKDTLFDNSKPLTLYTNDLLKNSIVNIEYNKEKDQYIVTRENGFVSDKDDKISNFYAKFNKYDINNDDNTITIEEKVIFTGKKWNNDNIISNIKVYRDIYHTKLIDEIKNPTQEQIQKFDINDYLKDANTITYTFKMDEDNNYYFYSSKVEE